MTMTTNTTPRPQPRTRPWTLRLALLRGELTHYRLVGRSKIYRIDPYACERRGDPERFDPRDDRFIRLAVAEPYWFDRSRDPHVLGERRKWAITQLAKHMLEDGISSDAEIRMAQSWLRARGVTL